MKKFKILSTTIRLKDLNSDDWYEDWGDDLELKTERLRLRQDRKFKHIE